MPKFRQARERRVKDAPIGLVIRGCLGTLHQHERFVGDLQPLKVSDGELGIRRGNDAGGSPCSASAPKTARVSSWISLGNWGSRARLAACILSTVSAWL